MGLESDGKGGHISGSGRPCNIPSSHKVNANQFIMGLGYYSMDPSCCLA